MMIKVQIEGIEKIFSELSVSWVHEQIKQRQRDGLSVCVRVFVTTGNIDLVLSSGECFSSGASNRRATKDECRIFDLWDDFQLKNVPINSGRVISFLQKIKQLA